MSHCQLSKDEADSKLLNSGLHWGKYAIITYFNDGNNHCHMSTASGGYMYSHVWSAKAFGIKNRGYGKPTKENRYAHCAVINIETGRIEWRNYE